MCYSFLLFSLWHNDYSLLETNKKPMFETTAVWPPWKLWMQRMTSWGGQTWKGTGHQCGSQSRVGTQPLVVPVSLVSFERGCVVSACLDTSSQHRGWQLRISFRPEEFPLRGGNLQPGRCHHMFTFLPTSPPPGFLPSDPVVANAKVNVSHHLE